jgi:hypothetical protein
MPLFVQILVISVPITTSMNWNNSIGKKLLEEDLRSGEIPLDGDLMKPQEVFLQ